MDMQGFSLITPKQAGFTPPQTSDEKLADFVIWWAAEAKKNGGKLVVVTKHPFPEHAQLVQVAKAAGWALSPTQLLNGSTAFVPAGTEG